MEQVVYADLLECLVDVHPGIFAERRFIIVPNLCLEVGAIRTPTVVIKTLDGLVAEECRTFVVARVHLHDLLHVVDEGEFFWVGDAELFVFIGIQNQFDEYILVAHIDILRNDGHIWTLFLFLTGKEVFDVVFDVPDLVFFPITCPAEAAIELLFQKFSALSGNVLQKFVDSMEFLSFGGGHRGWFFERGLGKSLLADVAAFAQTFSVVLQFGVFTPRDGSLGSLFWSDIYFNIAGGGNLPFLRKLNFLIRFFGCTIIDEHLSRSIWLLILDSLSILKYLFAVGFNLLR